MTDGMGWPESVMWIAVLATIVVMVIGLLRYLDGPTKEQCRRLARKQKELEERERRWRGY